MNSNFLKNNLSLKIISVIVAIILWLYAVSELNPETTKTITDVPVEVINMDALNEKNLTLVDDPVSSISIRIRGLVNDIRKVNISNLKAVLDLSEIDWTGTRQVELNVEGLLPREVKLDKTPELSLTINEITRKPIPVVVELTGESEKNYRVHEPVIEPRTITIYGAQSLVDSVVQGVVQLDLDKAVSTIEQSIIIKLVDAAGRNVDSKYLNKHQSSALVTVPIYPIRSIEVRANITGEPAAGFVLDSVSVDPTQIVVNGYASVVEKLTYLTTEAIDIRNAVEDIHTTVDLVLDKGLYLEPGQPSKINVVVHISETSITNTIQVIGAEILNVPDGFTAFIEDFSMSVQLRGPYTVISPLTMDDLLPSVDLSQLITEDGELVPGQYTLPVVINVPDRTELVQVANDMVVVNVQLIEETEGTEEPQQPQE